MLITGYKMDAKTPNGMYNFFFRRKGNVLFVRLTGRWCIAYIRIFLEDFLALYFCQSRLKINMSKDNNRAIKKLQSMIRLELLKMSSIFQSSGFVNRENWRRFLGWIFIYFKWLRYIKLKAFKKKWNNTKFSPWNLDDRVINGSQFAAWLKFKTDSVSNYLL